MSAKSLFITGTDTGAGKTLISAALVRVLVHGGLKVGVMKPVASGSHVTAEGLRNDDALALIRQSNVPLPYETVNPYCFEPAIAPHIAAAESKVRIDLQTLKDAHAQFAARADVVVIEGAGGWLTPLNEQQTLADFASAVQADVVLAVGLRLGCINHALLTARAIEAAGLTLAGWIANAVDPAMPRREENVTTLRARLSAPLLGEIPYSKEPDVDAVAALLSVPPLETAPPSFQDRR